jgi:hypothetical protein
MHRPTFLFLAGLLLCAQSPVAGFPPGAFAQRGALDAAASSYTGPGNVVAGAAAFWGLRGYSSGFSGPVANICDVATGLTCADATWASGTLTVPTIGGVACNNSTNVCQVATLYDQSGALACGGATACDLSQTTVAKRPTLIVPGAANGCTSDASYCISFSAQCLPNATTPYTHALPISVVFIGNRTGGTSSLSTGVSVRGSTTVVGWAAATDALRITAGTAQTIAGTDNAWHAVQGIWSNSVGALSADGSTTTANNGTNAPTAQLLIMGSTANTCTGAALAGKMSEAGIWPLDFTSSISALNSNAHSYWGF